MSKKLLSMLLIAAMLLTLLPAGYAQCADSGEITLVDPEPEPVTIVDEPTTGEPESVAPNEEFKEIYINPVYRGLISEAQVREELSSVRANASVPKLCATLDQVVEAVREGMKAREESVSVIYTGSESFEYEKLMDQVLAHTGEPTEGDYLLWQYGGSSFSWYGSTFTFVFDYYTNAAQEAELDDAVDTLLASLDLSGKTDYQKVRAIYDYICANVVYDDPHLEDESYTLKFTPYAALINKTAVCQGYSLLMYRLLLTAGVDNRVVTSLEHAWNIVGLDGLYYAADSTWDAGLSRYAYFLLSGAHMASMPIHTLEGDYLTPEFTAAYPMSPLDYSERPPVLTEAFNSATGVRVSWREVPGAVKYQLLRKNLTKGETSWKVVGETTMLTLIDTTVASASRYTFTVQAVDADGNIGSRDETGRTCTYIAKADITELKAMANGVSITWSKPAGAKNFRVMRRADGTGTWTVLAVVEGTSYVDTSAEFGVKYWYTVRGVSMDNTVLINSYNGVGWSMKRLEAPVLTEAFNSATGVRVSWKPVPGAVKYRLLRKNVTKGETAWTAVGEMAEATLIDTSAVSASRYTYTVECVDSNGRTCSARNETGRTCTYIAMSRITTIGSVSTGVKLIWSQPAGAKNFRILRKVDGGSWAVLTDVLGTTYTDTTAQKGVKYWYTVRAITLAGDMYINSYNATGWSVTRK